MAICRDAWLEQLTRPKRKGTKIFADLAESARQLGFEHCSLGVRTPTADETGDNWWTNYPARWQKYYFEHECFRTDPVIQATSCSALPVLWSREYLGGPDSFWATASQFGVRHGWATAVYGPGGEVALISLARSGKRLREAQILHSQGDLLWLAHTSLAMLTESDEHEAAAGPPELSRREKEILHWALAGKTADQTAERMGITRRTVNFHVAEIMYKLGAANKTQAVARALMLHLIY